MIDPFPPLIGPHLMTRLTNVTYFVNDSFFDTILFSNLQRKESTHCYGPMRWLGAWYVFNAISILGCQRLADIPNHYYSTNCLVLIFLQVNIFDLFLFLLNFTI